LHSKFGRAFKKGDNFKLNEVVKDLILDICFLVLEKEKLVIDLLPIVKSTNFKLGRKVRRETF